MGPRQNLSKIQNNHEGIVVYDQSEIQPRDLLSIRNRQICHRIINRATIKGLFRNSGKGTDFRIQIKVSLRRVSKRILLSISNE